MAIGFYTQDPNSFIVRDDGVRFLLNGFTQTGPTTATSHLSQYSPASSILGAVPVNQALIYHAGMCYIISSVDFVALQVTLTQAATLPSIQFTSPIGQKTMLHTGQDAKGYFVSYTRKQLSFDLAGAPWLPEPSVVLTQTSTDGTVAQVLQGGQVVVTIHDGDVFTE